MAPAFIPEGGFDSQEMEEAKYWLPKGSVVRVASYAARSRPIFSWRSLLTTLDAYYLESELYPIGGLKKVVITTINTKDKSTWILAIAPSDLIPMGLNPRCPICGRTKPHYSIDKYCPECLEDMSL